METLHLLPNEHILHEMAKNIQLRIMDFKFQLN